MPVNTFLEVTKAKKGFSVILRPPEKIDYPNFIIGLIVTNHDSRSGFLSNRFSNSRMACLLRDTPAL